MEKAFLQRTGCDYIIVGEGELPMLQLLSYLEDGIGTLADVPSLRYLEKDTYHTNPLAPLIMDLDSLPYPKRENSLQMDYRMRRSIGILTGRGCPFHCAFCYEGAASKNVRFRSVEHVMEEIDYDFSDLEKKSKGTMYRFGFLEAAMRQSDLAWEVRDYLRDHPTAAVVNLGCGLDDTGRSCDNGQCRIYNLDFPDVIAVRDHLLPAGEREENIPCDLNDTAWFERIDASGGAVFFAAGVFYYFLKEQVRTLVSAMAAAFPGGKLVFDAACRSAVKLMLKTWIRSAEIQDVGAYFAVVDAAREITPWAENLRVTSRGYMLGYQSLRDPSVSGFFRLLAKIGDGAMKMQIVRIEFK